jgi:hypothetical protein
MILFDPSLFGQSYKITYNAAPEILTIHNLCRDDLERVTGADVLPKNFVPIFVDIPINCVIPATLAATITTATLAAGVAALIDGVANGTELDASVIVDYFSSQGISVVQLPFTMTGTIYNTDGSTTILSDENSISAPAETLPSQTSNYVTPRITQFYSGNIVVSNLTGNT